MRLFAGDDWAEDHHDVEVMDEAGRVLARKRLPGGVAGIAQLHMMVGGLLGEAADDSEVLAGIETDHGPWVMALLAAGYRVFPVNPQQSARFRARHAVSGAKSDAGDAHVLADMVRTDSHQLREAAGDSPQAAGIKVLARAHKTMIWNRTREVQRLRHQLLQYFPAALEAFDDLAGPEADPGAGVGGAEAGGTAGHHRAGHGHPGGAAQRSAGPAPGPGRRLRGHGPVPDRGHQHAERAGQDPARTGEGVFWPAPGR